MNLEQLILFILLPIVGYLVGSIPFAWVIGKAHGVDIRTVGSKNIGASNLGRTLGKKYFWQAFLLDAAKGFLPVLAAALILRHVNLAEIEAFKASLVATTPTSAFEMLTRDFNDPLLPWYPWLPAWSPLLTGIACVLGHVFPVWLQFKGGKGVATGFGVVLGFWPLYTVAGLFAGLFFVVMLMLFRYISLASITAAIMFATLVTVLGRLTYMGWSNLLPLSFVAFLFALMIIIRHRANIRRLLNGTEPKIGQREIEKAKLQPDRPNP